MFLMPTASSGLNSPPHHQIHRVVVVDHAAPEQSIKVMDSIGNVQTSGYVSGQNGVPLSFRTTATATSGFYFEQSNLTPKRAFRYGKARNLMDARVFAETAPSGTAMTVVIRNVSSGVDSPYITLPVGSNSRQIDSMSFTVSSGNTLSCQVVSAQSGDLGSAANVIIDLELL